MTSSRDQADPVAGFAALMSEVLAGSGGQFGHRQHVELTWLAIRQYGMPAAIRLVSDGIKHTARYAGAPQKYHETISRAWVELVAHHAIGHPADPTRPAGPTQPASLTRAVGPAHLADPARQASPTAPASPDRLSGHSSPGVAEFAAFAAGNPLLLDKRLLTRFYSPATLAAPAARTGWIEPDRAPFPWAGTRQPAAQPAAGSRADR